MNKWTLRPSEIGIPGLLIWGALFFNWLLAFVNARGVGVSSAYVAVCETLLLAAALLYMLRRGALREQVLIICVYALCFVFTLLRFVIAQDVEVKLLRDMAIIFVFLSLGFSAREEPYRLVFYISVLVAVIAALEVLQPKLYGTLFNVKSYYISSRGFSETAFWNADSELFVSATRPGERFFPTPANWPRASSIFLEPVSLGNFIIVSLMVLLAGWQRLPTRIRIVWVATLGLLLLFSDSRFAFACSLLLVMLYTVLRRTPQQLSFLLFALMLLGGVVLVWVSGKTSAADDFMGRIFYSLEKIGTLDLSMLLGMKFMLAANYMDSGLVYFIVSQSLLVLILLLLLYSIGLVVRGPEAKLYKHYVLVVLALNLLISNSFFSMKVAALLWFCLGAFARVSLREPVPAPAAPRSDGVASASALPVGK
jgi:putative polymerase